MKLNYFFIFATLFFSCSSTRNNTINKLGLISYESGSCYGKCEVFVVKINFDETIEYEGLKNVEKIGKYRAKISGKDFNEINKLVSRLDLESLNEIYTSNSTDLNLRILFLNNNKQNKKILLFDNVPPDLKDLEAKIYLIIEQYKSKFIKQ